MNKLQTERGETEVLIVGAGPTGLLAAGELARRGVAVRVVERAAGRSEFSKALVVQARTLEVMDIIGLSDEFVRRGYPAPGLNMGLDSGREPVSVEMTGLDTSFPYLLVLPQHDTEEILESRLDEQDVEIERGVEFVGVERQGDGHVVSTVRLPDGREESIRSRYLLGSDGAHSAVRRAVGLPFEGTQHDSVVFLADVKIDSEFVKSRITNFTSPRGFVSMLPFLGDYSRVFAVDFAKQDRPPDHELTLADLQDTVDTVTRTKLAMSEPRWITRFFAPSRQVPTNRAGRVFLAGDAAHAHSPAGGQGMNTGLQDAFNLAWKLAMVVRGDAPEDLLSSYDAERHPVDARVQRETDRMLRSFLLRNPVLKFGRDLAARTLVPLPPVQRRLAGDLSGIGVDYRFTARSRGTRCRELPRGAAQAGDRVPDVEFWDMHRPSVRLHELLREPGYALFVFVSSARFGDERGSLDALLRSANEVSGGLVRSHLVLDEGVPEAAGPPTLVDFKGQFRGKLGARHASVLLVRPDGYVAFHKLGLGPKTLVSELEGWILRDSPSEAALPRLTAHP